MSSPELLRSIAKGPNCPAPRIQAATTLTLPTGPTLGPGVVTPELGDGYGVHRPATGMGLACTGA